MCTVCVRTLLPFALIFRSSILRFTARRTEWGWIRDARRASNKRKRLSVLFRCGVAKSENTAAVCASLSFVKKARIEVLSREEKQRERRYFTGSYVIITKNHALIYDCRALSSRFKRNLQARRRVVLFRATFIKIICLRSRARRNNM